MFNDNGNGGFGGIWIFALLILLGLFSGGFGGFGNSSRVGEAYATQADIQRAVDLDTLKSGQSAITNALKDAAYNHLGEIRDNGMMIERGLSEMKSCCCEINRNIDSVRFDMSRFASEINSNVGSQVQKVLDRLSADREAALNDRIRSLELDRALCGIPRTSPYGYRVQPDFGCGGYVN